MEKVAKIRFKKYKSFSDKTYNEFEIKRNVNLFIGKNNSGKSSCLDVVEAVFDQSYYTSHFRDMDNLEIAFELDEPHVSFGFSKDYSSPYIGMSYYDYGCRFIGKKLYLKKEIRSLSLLEEQPEFEYQKKVNDSFNKLARFFGDYYKEYIFRRVDAERDILAEPEAKYENVKSNGSGATNLVRMFITHSQYDENIVEKTLLNELNYIMAPDSVFTNIKVQQVEQNGTLYWEIFLEEKDTGRFALSKSGSGLKTILLVLINLYLIPELDPFKAKKLVYAFEELENNLHPALQRRLFDYLYEFSEKKDVHIFLTSHSSVAINSYYGKKNAQIHHVTKRNNESVISSVNNDIDNYAILDDLDVRASDLLQSNGIIWVEGPSDRVYIKHWLQQLCKCSYKEGSDYQFLYYGGRLLSHYSLEETEELINILTTNRNAAIVIDSDKKANRARINDTKRRIQKEFEERKVFCWITKGKEVENYLPAEAINQCFMSNLPQIGQYELFPDYINSTYKNFNNKKVAFSHKIIPYITEENSKELLDLKEKVEKLYKIIKGWNGEVL